jgi:hypothetical protein
MSNLEDTVRSVVEEFVKSNELFTALDVSNKVKLALPFARHREVREVVRGLFTSDIEPKGWARSPIAVTLPNGNQETALLYHPLADSWDLDTKYDTQKRNQAALNPAQQAVAVVTQAVTTPPPAPVAAAPVVPAPLQSARQQWDSLFKTQPSLFPSR